MQRQHAGAAGLLVQAIDVLGDQRQPVGVAGLEFGQRHVAGVGLRVDQPGAALGVPVPDTLRVGAEGLGRGQFLRAEVGPQAGLRVAESGHAGLGADAGAREHGDARRFAHPPTCLIQA